MPPLLWVSLGIAGSIGAFLCLVALRARRNALRLSSAPPILHQPMGPHQPRTFLPERYVNRQAFDPSGLRSVVGLSKTEAEELLDWLEANGFERREVLAAGDRFTIRYG